MKTYPEIDYVLKGDFQEYSTMKLIDSVEKNIDLGTVPNLVYRDEMRHVRHNPNSKENTVNNVFLNYKVLMSNAIKYHDVKGHLPYADWINNPESVTIKFFTSKVNVPCHKYGRTQYLSCQFYFLCNSPRIPVYW